MIVVTGTARRGQVCARCQRPFSRGEDVQHPQGGPLPGFAQCVDVKDCAARESDLPMPVETLRVGQAEARS